MPHQLNLLDGRPAPQPDVWDRLNDDQRTTVIDTIARVISRRQWCRRRTAQNTRTSSMSEIHSSVARTTGVAPSG